MKQRIPMWRVLGGTCALLAIFALVSLTVTGCTQQGSTATEVAKAGGEKASTPEAAKGSGEKPSTPEAAKGSGEAASMPEKPKPEEQPKEGPTKVEVRKPVTPPEREMRDIVDTAVAAGDFNTLAAALKKAGLIDTLKGKGPFTVFAPTDKAFEALPKEMLDQLMANPDRLKKVLLYHVVSGEIPAEAAMKLHGAETVEGDRALIKTREGTVFINAARVSKPDIMASNGVIHVIDAVILPPSEKKDIVDTAVGAGTFKTLAKALQTAGLIDTLKSEGPFTVFAPTDAAFAALPEGTLDELMENPERLKKVLLYHVLSGRVFSDEAAELDSAKTAEGQNVMIKAEDGTVKVNNAQVVTPDIMTRNGVIHVIDAVLLPPEEPTTESKAPATE